MGHHSVPQFYLGGFSVSTGSKAVWQFDKSKSAFSSDPAAIKNIAQTRQFYEVNTETKLNEEFEKPGNEVLRKLRRGDSALTDSEKRVLSTYIATMIKRVPNHRSLGQSLAPTVLADVVSKVRKVISNSRDTGRISVATAKNRLEETDAVELKFRMNPPTEVVQETRNPMPAKELIDLIHRMEWRFIRAERREFFVTTDNPVFFFDWCGLGSEKSEFTFPVSSELAIFGSWFPATNPSPSVFRGLVKEANRRLITDATRFVYSKTKADWIPKVAAKKNPRLTMYQWD